MPDVTSPGAPTEFVLTFRDHNPSVEGISLQAGGTVTVEFPDAFTSGSGRKLAPLARLVAKRADATDFVSLVNGDQ